MLFLQTTKFSPFRRGTAYELSREISGKKLMELSNEGDKIERGHQSLSPSFEHRKT
jgi:hypothetical protein